MLSGLAIGAMLLVLALIQRSKWKKSGQKSYRWEMITSTVVASTVAIVGLTFIVIGAISWLLN